MSRETVIRRLRRDTIDDEPRLCDEVNEVNSADTLTSVLHLIESYVDALHITFKISREFRLVVSSNEEELHRPVKVDYEDLRVIIDSRYLEFIWREFEYFRANICRYIDKVSREFIRMFIRNIYYKPRDLFEEAIVNYVAALSSSLRPLGAGIGFLILEELSEKRFRSTILKLVADLGRCREFIDILYSLEYFVCELVPLAFSEPLARSLISIVPSNTNDRVIFERDLMNLITRPMVETLDMLIHELNMYAMDRVDFFLEPLRVLLQLRSHFVKMF